MRFETVTIDSPIGAIALAWQRDVVFAAEMGWAKSRTRWETRDAAGSAADHIARRLQSRFPGAEIAAGSPNAAPVLALRRYFEGETAAIDALAVDPGGEGFHARVWSELRRIPSGSTCTYAEIAAKAGSPGSARAAGGAVGANPIPIVIPCHRVVGASGKLTGFGGGLPRKRWLLVHERASFVDDAPRQLSLSWAPRSEEAARSGPSSARPERRGT